MNRTRDDFFQNVRSAVRFAAPTVDADNPYTNPEDLRKKLSGAPVWLAPQSVGGYRPEDFADLSSERQNKLRRAVEDFLAVAREVPPDGPVTAAQIRAALPPFMEVVTTAQGILRQEWLDAVEAVIRQAEQWSEARGWVTQRDEKQIAEDSWAPTRSPRS
jgi:hypothetical protein